VNALLGDRKNEIDHIYGVYLSNNSTNDLKDDSITIDNVRSIDTPGLYELIFKRSPDDAVYTEDDKQTLV